MSTPSDALMRAIQAAEGRYTVLDWQQISPHVRTAAIYEELRRLDAERAGAPAPIVAVERQRGRRYGPGRPAAKRTRPA